MQAIVATDETGGIARDGAIPWHSQEDLALFKERTMGGVVIMGGATWRSLPKRPLPGRINVVLSRSPPDPDAIWCSTPEEVLEFCRSHKRVYLIGGAEVYRVFSKYIERIYWTKIPGDYSCDTHFQFDTAGWSERSLELTPGVCVIEYTAPSYRPDEGEDCYLALLRSIIERGCVKGDRTGVGTRSLFGGHLRFHLSDGFPLLTTKRMFLKGIVEELLFFIRGDSDNSKLTAKGVHIWDGNTSRAYLDSIGLSHYEEGTLGAAYGHQWRHWGATYETRETDYSGRGIDQLAEVVRQLREDPDSRRIILSAWNVSQLPEMALPPCHMLYQFYTRPLSEGRVPRRRPLSPERAPRELCCSMTQRSGDMFLGVPFNIASTALLTTLLAKLVGYEPGEIVVNIADAHIYENHLEQVTTQLTRMPLPFPHLEVPPVDSLEAIGALSFDDFKLKGYRYHPAIKAPMAV